MDKGKNGMEEFIRAVAEMRWEQKQYKRKMIYEDKIYLESLEKYVDAWLERFMKEQEGQKESRTQGGLF